MQMNFILPIFFSSVKLFATFYKSLRQFIALQLPYEKKVRIGMTPLHYSEIE